MKRRVVKRLLALSLVSAMTVTVWQHAAAATAAAAAVIPAVRRMAAAMDRF